VNHKGEYAAGFAWRRPDRATGRGGWLRDAAIALGVALAAMLLFMAGNAYAQDRVIQISGNTHTAFSGAKMESAVERYRTNRVIQPQGMSTSANYQQGSTNQNNQSPVGPTVTQSVASVK
jgi:hypothetical protein